MFEVPSAFAHSDVSYNPATRQVTFKTTRLGALAVIQRRTQLAPFRRWWVQPAGHATAALTVEVRVAVAALTDRGKGPLDESLTHLEPGAGARQPSSGTLRCLFVTTP
jgi:hypothetical protein